MRTPMLHRRKLKCSTGMDCMPWRTRLLHRRKPEYSAAMDWIQLQLSSPRFMRSPMLRRRMLDFTAAIDWILQLLLSSRSSLAKNGPVKKPSAMPATFASALTDVKVGEPEADYMIDKMLPAPVFKRDVKRMVGQEDDYNKKAINGDMMDENLWGYLPQVVIEEVLARVPFKLLFQCRVLSWAWRWNDRGRTTSLNRKQQTSHFFENAISVVSSNWPTYCPVYVSQDGLLGFNSQSKAWEKTFDLEMSGCDKEGINSKVASCAGSLVCFACVGYPSVVQDINLVIANVVTRKVKTLPPRPNMQRPNIMHLLPVGATAYKVILLTQIYPAEVSSCVSKTTIVTQVYDSATNSWTQKSSKLLMARWMTSLSNFVYIDGVFYIATGGSSPLDPPLLHFHHVEKGTWNTVQPPLPVHPRQLAQYYLLLSGSEVIMVAKILDQSPVRSGQTPGNVSVYKDVFVRAHNFLIFKVDLATGRIKPVSRCPRDKLPGVAIDQVIAYGDTIYFGGNHIRKTPMMMYNVFKDEWTYHISAWEMPQAKLPLIKGFFNIKIKPDEYHWAGSALQPGLNPFAEV